MPKPRQWENRMLREIDIPPLWLAVFIFLVWVLDRMVPGLATGWTWLAPAGWVLVVLGLAIMGLALVEFLRNHTTFVPRREPTAFLRHGVYRFTRNPIYLGDALVLTGLILVWDVLPALVLVPVFMALIARRYIEGEEAGLEAKFGAEFTEWKRKVRRWL